MSLAVSPSLTPMGRSDAGTDPAARALQALVQMAANADAPLEAMVKVVAANNLTTLLVNGETLQVRLSMALPVGTALTIAPAPSNPAAVSVQVKPQVAVAQMAPEAPAQTAAAAALSAMTSRPVPDAPVRAAQVRQVQGSGPAAPLDEPNLSASTATQIVPLARRDGSNAPHGAAVVANGPLPSDMAVQSAAASRSLATKAPETEPVAIAPRVRSVAPGSGSAAAAPLPRPMMPGGAMPSIALPLADAAPVPAATSTAPAGPVPAAQSPAQGATPPPLPAPAIPTVPTEAGQTAPPSPSPPLVAKPAAAPPVQVATSAPVPATPTAASAPPAPVATVVAPDAPASPRTQAPEPARPAAIPYATAPRPSAPPGVASALGVPHAAATQQPLAPMLADAAKLAADPTMPQPLRAAAQQVVAQALDPARVPVDAVVLRQAVETAGVLRPLTPLGTPDLPTRLTALRDVLARLLGDAAAPLANDRRRQPSVPVRGDAPHAERSEMVSLVADVPGGLAHRLLAETDGALSRLKLLQAASLPADGRAPDPARPAEYRVEIPMLLGREATTIQFVFDREAQPQEPRKPRGWRMRFALNVAALGEVGADISILGAATQVTVWASETETAALIAAMLPELGPALAARGLEPGGIRMRHGRPGGIAPGRLLDSAR